MSAKPAADNASSYARPEVLVETEWLAQHLEDPNLRIVESDEDILLYDQGHIPGAVMIDWVGDLNDRVRRDYLGRAGFERLTHDERIRMVREECYALALERVLIPAQDLGVPWDENLAFQHALRRVCTNLARGWFRDFAIDHYPEVSRYDKPFWREYQQALAAGKLRRKELPVSPEERRGWLAQYLDNQREKDLAAGLGSAAVA